MFDLCICMCIYMYIQREREKPTAARVGRRRDPQASNDALRVDLQDAASKDSC